MLNNQLIGQTLGTCRLQRLLGRGGMGAVYLAQQSRPRRTVAVKVLLPDLVLEERSRDEFLARFRREADAIAALDHINIMPIYEYGEQGETPYLVMPYVTGGTLREALERHGRLSLKQSLKIIEQTAAGLDSAHAKSIIHRDLKPGNILFHADGRVVIADFGLAKVLRDVTEQQESKHFLTSVGTIVGTPEYLSPEQSTGNTVDHRTDIYSLGIMLFHMLTGRVPFKGTSPVAVAIKHTLEAPPSMTLINPAIPASVEAVVMRAIAKVPEQRYASATEFAQALREAIAGMSDEEIARVTPHAGETSPENSTIDAPAANDLDTEPSSTETPVLPEDTNTAEDLIQTTTNTPLTTSEPGEPAPIPFSAAAGEMYNAPTEAALRLPAAQEQIANHPVAVKSAKGGTDAQRPQKLEPRLEKVARSAQGQVKERPLPTQPRGARSSYQSASMMLIGSIVTLLLIAGGFAAYLHFFTPSAKGGTVQTTVSGTRTTAHPTAHPTSAATVAPGTTATAAGSSPAVALPRPVLTSTQGSVGNLGALLYSANIPACGDAGGTWTTTANAAKQCSSSALELKNTGGAAGQATGIFLTALPAGKPLPNDYLVQVQVAINANTGRFGIFFRGQSGSPGAYSFLIDPASKTWTFYYYDNTNNGTSLINSVYPLQTALNGTLTLEVAVKANQFYGFVNETNEGNATSPTYTSGNIGLVADSGADVSFKSIAIYALS